MLTSTPGRSGVDLDEQLIVLPWVEEGRPQGFDPRHPYVEQFWLGILGPSAIWLLRRTALAFDTWPDGFELDRHFTAGALGLADHGRQSPFARTVLRLMQFGLIRAEGPGLYVRRTLPTLSARQIGQLPAPLRVAHAEWVASGRTRHEQRKRAERLAGMLLREGEWPTDVVQVLRILNIDEQIATAALRSAQTLLDKSK